MRRTVPFYPVAITLWYVLDLYRDSGLPTTSLFLPLLIAVFVGIVVQAVFVLLLRDRDRGSFIAALVLAAILQKALAMIGLTVVLAMLAAPGFAAIWRRSPPPRIRWQIATRVFNPVGAALVGITVVSLAFSGLLALSPSMSSTRTASASPDAPDIYLILLDGHPRWDTIESWGADGETFLAQLESRGFTTSSASRSNYMMTALSLASMIELSSVNDAPVKDGDWRAQSRWASDTISTGPALQMLHGHGYELVTSPYDYAPLVMGGADRVLDRDWLDGLEVDLLNNSVVAELLDGPIRRFGADLRRHRYDTMIKRLGDLAHERVDHPRFVLTHVDLPHLPPLYDEDLTPVDGWPCRITDCHDDPLGWRVPVAQRVKANLGNVAYVDQAILAAIDEVRSSNQRTPVIILFSDHGSRIDPGDRSEMFRTLFAASTPSKPNLFPDDVSLIEVLPLLFNAYLGTNLPIPDDTSYWLDMEAIRTNGLLDLKPMPEIDPPTRARPSS